MLRRTTVLQVVRRCFSRLFSAAATVENGWIDFCRTASVCDFFPFRTDPALSQCIVAGRRSSPCILFASAMFLPGNAPAHLQRSHSGSAGYDLMKEMVIWNEDMYEQQQKQLGRF